jgi:hypothetical protein
MDDPEARAYFALCDAQGELNALIDDDAAPEDIEAARQVYGEARRAWMRITGHEEDQEDTAE